MKIDIVQLELIKKGIIEFEGDGHIYNANDAKQLFVQEIGHKNVEHVAQICLNNANIVTNYSNVAIGTIENVNVTVSQIIKIALLSNASKIMIAHNHPSGVLEITSDDVKITKHIGAAAKIMGIQLIDSVIVNWKDEILSIREHIGDLKDE